MQYTREYKRKVFEALPPDLQEAILSNDNADKLATIRDKHGLMLDQAGELGDELGLFMLGLTRQDDFVGNLSKRLEIPREKAIQISLDINRDILDAVRSSLQKLQARPIQMTPSIPPTQTPPPNQPAVSLTPIERAANMTIIRKPDSHSPQYNHENLKKEDVLADLENIKNLRPENAENFVEHLLAGPVGKATEVEVKKPDAPKPKPMQQPIQPKSGPDPYREQV